MKKTDEKTNVMRLLDSKKVKYEKHLYVDTDAISGVEIAEVLHQDPDHVFKTLVTVGASKNYYVFMIPVERELDLKKAARAAGEKNIVMIKQKELLPLTGYIHGGKAVSHLHGRNRGKFRNYPFQRGKDRLSGRNHA